MKTVFNNRQLPHVWVNQTDAELDGLRSGRGSSFSFVGPQIDSYATTIARIYRHKGARLVLMDSASFSNSTSKHQNYIRNAMRGSDTLLSLSFGRRNQSLRFTPKELWEAAIAECQDFAAQSAKARGRAPYWLQCAEQSIRKTETIRQFFKLRNKPFSPDLSALVAHAKAQDEIRATIAAKALEKERARQAREEQLSIKFAPVMLAMWREHKEQAPEFRALQDEAKASGLPSIRVSHLLRDGAFQGNCALRLSLDRERVETNKGAQVLVRTVRFLWAFCSEARRLMESVDAATVARFPRLDHYNVSAIDCGGNVSAGCHEITFQEVQYIAKELGLPPFNGQPEEAPTIPAEEVTA